MFNFFPNNYIWSFQFQRAIGESHFHGGDFNECMMVVKDLKSKHDHKDWQKSWYKMAEKVFVLGNEAENANNRFSAKNAYFRATNYYRLSEFFLKGGDKLKLDIYKKSINSFHKALDLHNQFYHRDEQIKTLKIPYERSFMYGYLVPAKRKVKKDITLLFFGGLDSTAEELYFTAGKAFSDAGFDCVIVDGPGQGGTLRLNNLPAIAEYEKPVSEAIDFIENLETVNSKNIILIAMSMGGYYAPRAAAFESRIKGCIVWGAIFDYGQVWQSRDESHPLATQITWVLGQNNLRSAKEKLEKFSLKEVAHKIKCPIYILHGEEDQQVPSNVAEELYHHIKAKKSLKIFTKEEGGSAHCQYDNLHLAHQYMITWILKEFN